MKNIITRAIIVFAALITFVSCSNDYDINKDGGIRWVVEVDKTALIDSSNPDVEYEAAVQRTEQIIKTRLDNFCKEENTLFHKIKFNVKQSDEPGRIIIDLFPDKDYEAYQRIKRLISTTGNLEFWETYYFDEINEYFDQANAILAEKYETEDPLYSLLVPSYTEDGPIRIARVGIINNWFDIDSINKLLETTKGLNTFPGDMKLAWTALPEKNNGVEYFELIALKMTNGGCALDGSVITDAKQVNENNGQSAVQIQMDREGTNIWKLFTRDNIGRQIAITVDDYVFSYPVVNQEIEGGRCQIYSDGMTLELAQDLANIIKNGKFPFRVNVLEENLVEPQQAQ